MGKSKREQKQHNCRWRPQQKSEAKRQQWKDTEKQQQHWRRIQGQLYCSKKRQWQKNETKQQHAERPQQQRKQIPRPQDRNRGTIDSTEIEAEQKKIWKSFRTNMTSQRSQEGRQGKYSRIRTGTIVGGSTEKKRTGLGINLYRRCAANELRKT